MLQIARKRLVKDERVKSNYDVIVLSFILQTLILVISAQALLLAGAEYDFLHFSIPKGFLGSYLMPNTHLHTPNPS